MNPSDWSSEREWLKALAVVVVSMSTKDDITYLISCLQMELELKLKAALQVQIVAS